MRIRGNGWGEAGPGGVNGRCTVREKVSRKGNAGTAGGPDGGVRV